MLQAISTHPSERGQSAQAPATGFQKKAAASASEPKTQEQPTTTSIVEADGCKMLIIKKGKFVTMKINLGDASMDAPKGCNPNDGAQMSGKKAAPTAISPQENQYLQNDAAACGLAGGLFFTART